MGDLAGSVRVAAREAPSSEIIAAFNHGRDKAGLIPLWAGEGDLPTPRIVMESAIRSLRNGETFYTHSRGLPELRGALAAYYEAQYGRPFDPESFFVTGSGMQAIQIALSLTTGAGEEVLVPTPAWPNISGAANILGARAVPVPMAEDNGRWVLDVAAVEAAITPATRSIFVNSPANPTGWTADLATLGALLDLARRHDLWIIADEIYARFVYTGERRAASFLDIAEPDDRILYVNTFSKNWAMTGWRIGWLHASPALKGIIENLVQYSTSGTAVFIQRAAITALTEADFFVEELIRRARRGRDVVSEVLAGNNRVTYAPPDGAFYAFFKVEGLTSSKEAAFRIIDDALVGTAPGTAFGRVGEGYVRVCFLRSEDSLTEAMRRISRFLAE
jgi:aspartate/methionine/tyrosine aminotransferase